jgi:hypothetical protein
MGVPGVPATAKPEIGIFEASPFVVILHVLGRASMAFFNSASRPGSALRPP